MLEIKKELADFLVSDEGKKQFELSFLRQSQLVAQLLRLRSIKRPNVWVRLSNAAHFIRQQIPEEVADLEKRYGHKKLKGIILATEYFDISEELSDKGCVRILYRIKPELNLID